VAIFDQFLTVYLSNCEDRDIVTMGC